MKIIKNILVVIVILSLIFFATGLVVKETQYTTEITINSSINKVFDTFEDTNKTGQWQPEIKLIEPIQENTEKVGSTYKIVVENKEQKIEMIKKIMAYIPNKKITFQFDSNQMIKIDDYNFVAVGNTTKITQHSIIRPKNYIMSCIFPYFKSKLKKVSYGYLKQLKEVVEKHQ
ncbi:SRPBCC family protein [Tenacibaculum sp. UWU-22]|uniref:SRPBCC family protein n=1 Tax=Tenacibaculum sp. UWU-22 TaxID=3234187 RepID=UPI0034DAE0E1